MADISKSILEHLANPYILSDLDGRILRMNDSALSLFRSAQRPIPSRVDQIEVAGSHPPYLSVKKSGPKKIRLGGIFRTIHAHPVTLKRGQPGCLFLFDSPEILKKLDFDLFLDCIDESVTIADRDGILLHINSATSEISGFQGLKGMSLKEAVRHGYMDQSVTLMALESKKTEKMNIRFSNGRIATSTSRPLLDARGESEYVICTGRDVTKLVQLEKDLRKSENLKNRYYNRLSALESLVGGDKVIYASDKMKQVVSLAVKAAKSDSPVFIWGESGVGKELIADLIHRSSDRSKRTFVGVNCSAIPSELIEAEFFGYEEGAFTGARRGGKKGLLEEARHGTIFLDEITELSLPLQSKLLRVLQENEFMRVGGTKSIPLQARIISSSNLSKDQLADPEKFRRDLFYRLNVIPVFIPPLRQRREDIFPLIRFFLNNMNLKYGANRKLSMNLMNKLYSYHWPGNVRELKNIIESLIVTAEKDVMDIEDYQAISHFEVSDGARTGEAQPAELLSGTTIEQMEGLLIQKTVKACGSVKMAAKVLNINPSTIYRKVKKGLISLS